jgi:membrane protein
VGADLRLRTRLLLALLRESAAEWQDDDAPRFGAALAYYAMFAVAPLLVIATAVAGLLYEEADVRAWLVTELRVLLGPDGAVAVVDLLAHALPPREGLLPTAIGLVAMGLGATSVFVELRTALNTMWDVPPRPGGALWAIVREQAIGAGMVVFVGVLLLVSLVLGTAEAALEAELAPALTHLFVVAGPVTTLAVTTVVFAVLFKVLPDRRIAWGDVWVGALVTAALFTVGRAAIAVYLARSGVASAYGAAGALVALLVWIYYSAQIFLFGAELTQVYGRRAGSQQADARLLVDAKKCPPRPK